MSDCSRAKFKIKRIKKELGEREQKVRCCSFFRQLSAYIYINSAKIEQNLFKVRYMHFDLAANVTFLVCVCVGESERERVLHQSCLN